MNTFQRKKSFKDKLKAISLKKVICISVLALSSLLLFFLFTQPLMNISVTISTFFKGIFGLAFYGMDIALIVICSLLLAGKQIVQKPSYIANLLLLYFSIIFLVHLVTSGIYLGSSYAEYLAACFDYSTTPTFGGLFAGVFVYPIAKLNIVFAYVFFVAGIVITSLLAVNVFYKGPIESKYQPIKKPSFNKYMPSESYETEDYAVPYVKGGYTPTLHSKTYKREEEEDEPSAHDILFKNKEPRRRYKQDEESTTTSPLERSINTSLNFYDAWDRPVAKTYDTAPQSKFDEAFSDDKSIKTDKPLSDTIKDESAAQPPEKTPSVSDVQRVVAFSKNPKADDIIDGDNYKKYKYQNMTKQPSEHPSFKLDFEPFDEDDDAKAENSYNQTAPKIAYDETPFVSQDSSTRAFQQMVVNESEYSIPQYPQIRRYVKPSIELLDNIPVSTSATQEDIWANAALLEQALAEFRIDAKVQNIVRGPAVTRYELSLAPGISIKKIMVLTDDIARRMSVDAVRIEPTISGKDLFGIEVPNKKRDIVSLRSIIQSEEFMAPSQGLKFSLGMDIGGRIITPDITEMPHLLIAGSTGTGKSVCLNSIIISLMYKYSPDELRFILIDPKRVEFSQYRNMPHLMINEVVTDIEKTISVFNWAIDEMKRRYNLFAEAGNVKKLSEYNNAIDLSRAKKLPRIVIVVDELSDLIMYNKSEIEARIQALSALARAAGIHLILATQRPSVDIITGVIKANLPSRVAFKVTSMADSKTILDQGGPEKLLGKGDMLFITDNMPKPVRLQGSYVSTEEVSRVVSFIKQNNECDFDDEAADRIMREKNGVQIEGEIVDSLYMDILDFIVTTKEASISKVQRHFRIGFNRAGKIIEDMERRGFIGENNGSKSREVFITREEFERLKAENE